MPVPAAVLFDFNGTISLDEELAEEILAAAFHEAGIPWTRELYFNTLVGHPHETTVAEALRLLGREPEPELVKHLYRREREIAITVRAGRSTISAETAAAVRRVAAETKTAVVTSCRRVIVEEGLERAGLLASIDVIIALEDTDSHKPHPEPYTSALVALAVAAEDAIAAEDSAPGILSAQAAGLRVIGVGEFYPRTLVADAVDSLAEPRFLELLELAP